MSTDIKNCDGDDAYRQQLVEATLHDIAGLMQLGRSENQAKDQTAAVNAAQAEARRTPGEHQLIENDGELPREVFASPDANFPKFATDTASVKQRHAIAQRLKDVWPEEEILAITTN